MTSGVFGGGVIFVVAALLWAAVLVPSWVRRREFKSAEQNALRLQRTLRVLAETAEVPTEVRVEATAREALAHERLLRTAQRQQEAERKTQLAEARAAQLRAEMRAQQMKRKQAALVRSAKLRRPVVRRVRSFAALVFVLASVAVPVGVGLALAGLGPVVLLAGLAAAVAALGALVLLAPGRVKHVEIEAEHLEPRAVSVPAVPVAAHDTAEDRAAAAHAAAQAAAAARIERARIMTRARASAPVQQARENRLDSILLQEASGAAVPAAAPAVAVAPAPATATASVPAAGKAASNPFSQMGVIGDTSDGMLDLDAVLRTRRRAG